MSFLSVYFVKLTNPESYGETFLGRIIAGEEGTVTRGAQGAAETGPLGSGKRSDRLQGGVRWEQGCRGEGRERLRLGQKETSHEAGDAQQAAFQDLLPFPCDLLYLGFLCLGALSVHMPCSRVVHVCGVIRPGICPPS